MSLALHLRFVVDTAISIEILINYRLFLLVSDIEVHPWGFSGNQFNFINQSQTTNIRSGDESFGLCFNDQGTIQRN